MGGHGPVVMGGGLCPSETAQQQMDQNRDQGKGQHRHGDHQHRHGDRQDLVEDRQGAQAEQGGGGDQGHGDEQEGQAGVPFVGWLGEMKTPPRREPAGAR